MQTYEDIFYEENERAITGFINSSGELEYSIYKQVDGGCIDLEDKEYKKDKVPSKKVWVKLHLNLLKPMINQREV